MKGTSLLLCIALSLLASVARADVQRFAVVVGNDRGQGSDTPLRYAAADASKMASVLRDLGDFEPANIVLLRNESADVFRRTLIAVNDRIRQTSTLPGTETLLFVYYSGHADAQALRLSRTRLRLDELSRLVRGSAAKFRMLVVDACRSGSLTRVKGGKPVAPFSLSGQDGLEGEGMAFLTATSAGEDAQESDELKGSFFTHALVSGLLGAADVDGDGLVVLEEAYRHAYDTTLRSTSRTYAGTQHPTFQYDMRGQRAVVLTRLRGGPRGILAFPEGLDFLLLKDNAEGVVVAEVGSRDKARSLSLRPGRYFVRGRAEDALLEGPIEVRSGASNVIDRSELHRVEYARLVRKGERPSGLAHGLEAGVAGRTRLPNAATACIGGVLGYRMVFEHLTLFGRLGACTSTFENEALFARTNEFDASVAGLYAWDLPVVTVALGLGGGASTWTQRFETRGNAPGRTSFSPYGFAVLDATVDAGAGIFVSADVRVETHVLDLQETATTADETRTAVAGRGAVTAGLQF